MNTEDFRELIVGIATHQSEGLLTNSLFQVIAEYTAAATFADGKSDTPDRQDAGLGIAIAHWADWEGDHILRASFNALQDANFHTEAAQVQQMIDKLNREQLWG